MVQCAAVLTWILLNLEQKRYFLDDPSINTTTMLFSIIRKVYFGKKKNGLSHIDIYIDSYFYQKPKTLQWYLF